MKRWAEQIPQLRLRWLFEIVTAVGMLCAALVHQSLFLTWLVFALLTVWVSRVRDLELRWALMSCFGGVSVSFLGWMCLHLALIQIDAWERRWWDEYLAFAGPLLSICGAGFAVCGFVLACRHLAGLKVSDC